MRRSTLVTLCMDPKGYLSANRRTQYQLKVPADLFDALERAYREMAHPDSDYR